MDLNSILYGFEVALHPTNLIFVFLGVLIGTAIGVLPGLGPSATIALLLPITYTMAPETALIMLAGIYYGSMYGGTITSVLLNLPGEAASVITTLDGYQMAVRGRAGQALSIAAIGSFIGGMVSVAALIFVAPPLAALAIRIGPPEFAVLTLLGIALITRLGTGSTWKSLAAAAFGLLLGTVGQDIFTGEQRLIGGVLELADGFDFVVVAIGVFGIGEILHNCENTAAGVAIRTKLREFLPSRKEMKTSAGPIARGSALGFGIGLLPGGGGVLSSIISYAWEKARSKTPERFGRGAIEGVAGPETANNASSTSAFVPLLTLGLPSNAVLALLYGALLIQGITPGPQLMHTSPAVFWGVIASMAIGNVFLIILNLPLVGVFTQLLRIRMSVLGPAAILISLIGAYSLANRLFDVWLVIVFGVLGYLMRKGGFDAAPFVIAFILGPIMETSFRQSLVMSGAGIGVYLQRPAALAMLVLLVAVFAAAPLKRRFGGRRRAAGDRPEQPESTPTSR
ncbi:tripartite tricarboxylate transporter permease [Rhizomonospora bruguierae]|uniref:tripartite tricarboxylate transporter permease n=1 Tax=Rhizomonospora bruguierae TaxID=1581705 RepID=UPI001BCF716F|nr:tripartite tricarboxylate transporter permease [Micromonospora sp. NBRC 107566]